MNCQENLRGNPLENRVYLNKIFYDNSQTSCPLLYNLTTTPETFTQQLTFSTPEPDCGCNRTCRDCNRCNGCCSCNDCCNFALSEDTTFRITDSHVTVTTFHLSEASGFNPENVTIDGLPVTELALMNGQYVADVSGIMADITRCPEEQTHTLCHSTPDNRCNPPCDYDQNFFLAQVPGPWILASTFLLHGTATDGGRTCNFKLCLRTLANLPNGGISIPGASNFALQCVTIPCQVTGMSPSLVFDFEACATLLNPRLVVTVPEETPVLTLQTTLVLTPEIHLTVTRPTLFRINASEVPIPCDDLGQCDPCTPTCRCDETANTAVETAVCQPCNTFTTPCQCCDTNGYRF